MIANRLTVKVRDESEVGWIYEWSDEAKEIGGEDPCIVGMMVRAIIGPLEDAGLTAEQVTEICNRYKDGATGQ